MANQLLHGDCLEVMRGLPDNSVDAIVTLETLDKQDFQAFLVYNEKTGRCLQHPRHGNLVSVGHMNTLQDFVNRDCPVCGATYQADKRRLKHGRQTTCSRKCSYDLRALGLAKTKIRHSCPVCLSEFERLPCQNKSSQAIYCSQDCAYKGRALGFTKRTVTKPYDIVHSQEKPVFVDCQQCGKTIRTIPSKKDRTRFCSTNCQSKHLQDAMKGSANPSWVDGRSYEKRCYRGSEWERIRAAAYKRDNYTCQSCGVHCIGRKEMSKSNAHRLIQCHHIVFWKDSQDNSLENLVTLCASCHAKVHFGRADVHEPN